MSNNRIAELIESMERAKKTNQTDPAPVSVPTSETDATTRQIKLARTIHDTIKAFADIYLKLTNEDVLLSVTSLLATLIAVKTKGKRNYHQHTLAAILQGADIADKLGIAVTSAVKALHDDDNEGPRK